MNTKRWSCSATGWVIFVLLLAVGQAHGDLYDKVSLESLVQRSDVILTGSVVTVTGRRDPIWLAHWKFDPQDNIEVVSVGLTVDEALKGTGISESLNLTVLRSPEGLDLQGLGYWPAFTVGEEVCVFLTRSLVDQDFELAAGFQSKFTFQGETVLQSGSFQQETALEIGSERGAFMGQVKEKIRILATRPSMVQAASWGRVKSSTLFTLPGSNRQEIP